MKNKETNRESENREEQRNSKENETPIYLTGDSTLQTPEEDEKDKSKDPRRDETMEPSNDDLHEINADRLAGSDHAGTVERKE